jgi:small subunit ribosomal protein S7
MRGTKTTPKRMAQPDERFNSALIGQFINKIMKDGKKTTATKVVYTALEGLQEATHRPALEAFELALRNISPAVEVRSKRIGGATYQVPMEVRQDRKTTLAMRWLIESARKRQGGTMGKLLLQELLDAYNSTGAAMKKRDDLHKMADANKAFAHFARF